MIVEKTQASKGKSKAFLEASASARHISQQHRSYWERARSIAVVVRGRTRVGPSLQYLQGPLRWLPLSSPASIVRPVVHDPTSV